MIETKFEQSGDALIMDMKGHASFAEMGKDPVCAGASILAMTVAQCVRNMSEEKKLTLFCRLAAEYYDDFRISEETANMGYYTYPLIYPR